MIETCLHVCIRGRLSASLLTWRPQFPAGHCSLILPGWVSSGLVSRLLVTNRYNSLFQTRYQPLWIDTAPEKATFACQNLNKLKEGRVGLYRQRHNSLLRSLWCKEWLGFITTQSKSSRVFGMDGLTWERREQEAEIFLAYHAVSNFQFPIVSVSQEGLPPHLYLFWRSLV